MLHFTCSWQSLALCAEEKHLKHRLFCFKKSLFSAKVFAIKTLHDSRACSVLCIGQRPVDFHSVGSLTSVFLVKTCLLLSSFLPVWSCDANSGRPGSFRSLAWWLTKSAKRKRWKGYVMSLLVISSSLSPLSVQKGHLAYYRSNTDRGIKIRQGYRILGVFF